MDAPDRLRLPRVDRVAARVELDEARKALGERVVVDLVRGALAEARRALLAGDASTPPDEAAIALAARARGAAILTSRLRRVINATGVLLHTNLGRAPLGEAAHVALADLVGGYCSLELDLATGKRGGRGRFMEAALRALTGAEAAIVVNNCAAAVLLLLAALARGREVIVSRGELVEIGGGFRVPEIMAESGAVLVEVGTTNKTRADDYARALDAHPSAAAILRVHQSNFVQLGFVERPSIPELAELARQRGLPLLEDLGGGALVDLSAAGLSGEPTVSESIAAGANAVVFSGDKALGGPQAGVIVGDEAIVDRVRKHPLARAMRLGRLPMAALETTLAAYLEGRAASDVPLLAMAHAPEAGVRARAERWAAALGERGIEATVVSTEAELGGGALPGRTIASAALRLAPRGKSVDAFSALLRAGRPAVIGRVHEGAVLFDARTVLEGEDDLLLASIVAASAEG